MKLKDIYMRDPYVFVEDGVAYLVGTTDETCWGGKASSFLGYRSTNLEDFEGPFTLFTRSDDFWADENFWAPELHKVDGKYLLVASFFKKGMMRRSQVLVSDSPLGTYVPTGSPFTPEDWMSLDATLYEEDGHLYTVFCHEWLQTYYGHMDVAELDKKGFDRLLSEPEVLFKASDAKWVVLNVGGDRSGYVTDGPTIMKLKNGKLIMLWSSQGKEGYAVGMAVSENGVKGPWRHIDEPLFRKDGGHAMVFSFKGKTYLSLHCPNGPHMAERPHFYELEEDGDILRIKGE